MLCFLRWSNLKEKPPARFESPLLLLPVQLIKTKGVRDVYDTRTGQTHSVDLFNVNGIVEGLNSGANDPNRFVQIPLRYER